MAAKPLLIELHGTFDIAPGDRRLRLVAGPDLPRMGETEIALDLVAGWDARWHPGRGRAPHPHPPAHAPVRSRTGRRPAPVAVTFLLRARPATDGTPARWPWGRAAWGLVAAAVAATLALAVMALRARKPGDRAS